MTQVKNAPNRKRFNPLWGLLLVPVLGAGLFVSGVLKPKQNASDNKTKIETTQVTRGTFRVSVTGPGTLKALQSLDIKPEVNGAIKTLPKEGARFNKGQLIATLDRSNLERSLETAKLSLEKARAQLESSRSNQASSRASQFQTTQNAQTQVANAQLDLQNAQLAFTNTKRLFDAGGASRVDLQNAQSQVEKAQNSLENTKVSLVTAQNAVGLKAGSDTQDLRNLQLAIEQAQIQYSNAQTDLSKTKIYAAISGVVSSVVGSVGGPASNGQALFTMLEDSSIELPVQVDETEITKVKIGQVAEVSLDALPNEKFKGKVTRISANATIQQNIAVFYVTVTLPNTDLRLRPGMTSEAEIISQEVPDALQVSKRAVQQVRSRSYVDVLGEDGKTVETVRVTTGPDDGSIIVITDGLKAGQNVVLPTRAVAGSTTTGGSGP